MILNLFRQKGEERSLQCQSLSLITRIKNDLKELEFVNEDIDLRLQHNEEELTDLRVENEELIKQKSVNKNLIDKISKYL